MPSVYLCGTMNDNPKCIEWRKQATDFLAKAGISVLDPCRKKGQKEWSTNGFEGPGTIYDHGAFVARDDTDIQNCQALLMYWWGEPGRQSVGTWMELGYAKAFGKPMVVVDITDTYLKHPFVYKNSAAMFKDLDSGLKYLDWLLGE